MGSNKECCVPGCPGNIEKVLHSFPNPEKDRDRFNKWLFLIGGDIVGLKNEFIYKLRRVCRRHFEEKYLCRFNNISKIAIPTLYMPDPLSLKYSIKQSKPFHQTLNTTIALTEPSTSTDPVPEAVITKPEKVTTNLGQSSRPAISKKYVQRNQTVNITNVLVKKKTRRVFLTNAELELRNKLIAAKIKLCKYKNNMILQSAEIRAAKRFTTNPAVVNAIENCSTAAKLLMQFRVNKNKKGRRFTLQQKILALSILKQSRKGYRFLRNIFILPAPQTLIKLIEKAGLTPGVNQIIFSQLKNKVNTMKTEEKICVLLFDEISLKANLSYQDRKGKICGFVDDGLERKAEYADHAQVFMVRGLIHNYRQPVFYSFSASATKGPELAKQIKIVVTELQQAGLIVVASVCDQGTNNIQALKLLLNETRGIYLRRGEILKENIVLINNQEIIPLYDPPHLIKGIRNHLMTKNLQYTEGSTTKTAKWAHLLQLYTENPGYGGNKMIPKLTYAHVIPEKNNKMKVKFATQVFSRTVAANMGYLAEIGILPSDCQETADLFLCLDNIFDSMNGSFTKGRRTKPLLHSVTPNSSHHTIWMEGRKIIGSMKFITATGKVEAVPTVNTWLWTLEAVEVLLQKLRVDFGVNSIWMRHLQLDPLENFFGAIRSHGCRKNNPTCEQFELAFTTLLISNITSVHSHSQNCEDDLCGPLHTLVIPDQPDQTSSVDLDFEIIINTDFKSIEEKEKYPRIIAPLQYVSRYILNKTKARIFQNCSDCKKAFMCDVELEMLEYIRFREYAGRRSLCTPSHELIKLISNIQDVIEQVLKQNLERKCLKYVINTALKVLLDLNFITCNMHKEKFISYLMNICCRFMVFNYCKNLNKIMYGKNEINDYEDVYQVKAKKFLTRCCKRKKKVK